MAAALLWHSNSGTDRFAKMDLLNATAPDDPAYNRIKEELVKEIRDERLSYGEKHNLASQYYAAAGRGGYGNSKVDCDILTCSSCGIRDTFNETTGTVFHRVNLHNDLSEEALQVLKLTKSQDKEYCNEKRIPNFDIPIDASGSLKSIDLCSYSTEYSQYRAV